MTKQRIWWRWRREEFRRSGARIVCVCVFVGVASKKVMKKREEGARTRPFPAKNLATNQNKRGRNNKGTTLLYSYLSPKSFFPVWWRDTFSNEIFEVLFLWAEFWDIFGSDIDILV